MIPSQPTTFPIFHFPSTLQYALKQAKLDNYNLYSKPAGTHQSRISEKSLKFFIGQGSPVGIFQQSPVCFEFRPGRNIPVPRTDFETFLASENPAAAIHLRQSLLRGGLHRMVGHALSGIQSARVVKRTSRTGGNASAAMAAIPDFKRRVHRKFRCGNIAQNHPDNCPQTPYGRNQESVPADEPESCPGRPVTLSRGALSTNGRPLKSGDCSLRKEMT